MQWIPTFSLFLFLYPAGWFISHFFYLINRNISANDLSIIGTIITFSLFLILLPSWGKIRWKTKHLWLSIGLDYKNKFRAIQIFFRGFILSFFLLLIFSLFIFLCGWVDSIGYIKVGALLNAILLIVGIVFAEEIVFRVWLLEEMVFLFGLRRGIIFQSAIFSLAHYRSDIGLLALIPFLTGLFLFGIVLTLRRTIDKGSLLGCIGLHGGLVGIWHIFDSGMVVFSIETPYFLLGPSKDMINPIGSVIGITILSIIIFFQRRLFERTGRFLVSTVNASSKDETP
ncbi:CPBP family intramembrane glutamic endopeptidase [Prochlorococcus marinus]|uniref:CPBP family intramembrane glutamic endopeptidase n=1 Tax=Prochlorococcus marinus TaxID=1219 RepID=UPI0022B2DA39|nr:CPBP family intramembrane glutamic endopeptidase [Prochlorococcus marinus]